MPSFYFLKAVVKFIDGIVNSAQDWGACDEGLTAHQVADHGAEHGIDRPRPTGSVEYLKEGKIALNGA